MVNTNVLIFLQVGSIKFILLVDSAIIELKTLEFKSNSSKSGQAKSNEIIIFLQRLINSSPEIL